MTRLSHSPLAAAAILLAVLARFIVYGLPEDPGAHQEQEQRRTATEPAADEAEERRDGEAQGDDGRERRRGSCCDEDAEPDYEGLEQDESAEPEDVHRRDDDRVPLLQSSLEPDPRRRHVEPHQHHDGNPEYVLEGDSTASGRRIGDSVAGEPGADTHRVGGRVAASLLGRCYSRTVGWKRRTTG